MTFIEPLAIGLGVTLISAAMLKKKGAIATSAIALAGILLNHQVRRTRDKPCLGRVNCKCAVPRASEIHAGEVSSCNCAARCNWSYCPGEGDCGDPISFQAVNALL
jgi:hypothetical protein